MNYVRQKLTFNFFWNKWFIMFLANFFHLQKVFSCFLRQDFFCKHIEDIFTFIERYFIISEDTWNLFCAALDPLFFFNRVADNIYPFLMTDFPQYQAFCKKSPLYFPSQQSLKSIHRELAGNVQCPLLPR